MRKQTKVVAVASAAALLAIGGAMTSFAAQGWVEEDGTWYYYDKDGSRVEDTWKKSGETGSGLILKRVAQWLPTNWLRMMTTPTM